ncbi:MAG: serine hydrolase, partial [Solobacterium sp.]|nr:serine hydrolase [Solobacterium sp.]
MNLPKQTQAEIAKLYKNRAHVELTVGILKDGRTEVVHWNPKGQIAEGEELVYPVGSICKLFTASLTAKYIDEGKLKLDGHINDYIEGLPEQYYPTLRRLATHTSGYTTQPYNF